MPVWIPSNYTTCWPLWEARLITHLTTVLLDRPTQVGSLQTHHILQGIITSYWWVYNSNMYEILLTFPWYACWVHKILSVTEISIPVDNCKTIQVYLYIICAPIIQWRNLNIFLQWVVYHTTLIIQKEISTQVIPTTLHKCMYI